MSADTLSSFPARSKNLAVDLGNPGDTTIDDIDAVVITLTPDDYSDASYEQTYRRGVEGLISILSVPAQAGDPRVLDSGPRQCVAWRDR